MSGRSRDPPSPGATSRPVDPINPTLGTALILRLDGGNLHYWLVGPETSPVDVFTTGATADRRLFLPQVPAISKHYRMLLWDVRGNGRSQPAAEVPTAQRAATDLSAVLDHLGLDRVALVCQSFGGLVGQELIFRQPERVSAAVMLGTTCLTMPMYWRDRFALSLSSMLIKLNPKPLLKRQVPKAVAVTESAQRVARAMLDGLSPGAINLIYAGVAGSMHVEPGYRIELPLLICHDRHEHLGNVVRTAGEWVAREPRAEFAIIPGAGHNANLDNPEFFNALVLTFLNRFSASADNDA